MRFMVFLFAMVFGGSALASTWCDELWFTRNLVMNNAGYCFGSNLGRTYFDNSDCVGKSVSPSAAGARLIARIQSMEAEAGCKGQVNTGGTVLDVLDIGIRYQLNDLPLATEFPGACVGWRGRRTPLHAGKREEAFLFGVIEPGDRVSFDHEPEDGWVYVTVHEGQGEQGPWILKSGGWSPQAVVNSGPCDMWLP